MNNNSSNTTSPSRRRVQTAINKCNSANDVQSESRVPKAMTSSGGAILPNKKNVQRPHGSPSSSRNKSTSNGDGTLLLGKKNKQAEEKKVLDAYDIRRLRVERVEVFKGHFTNGWIECMTEWEGHLITGSADDTLRCWNVTETKGKKWEPKGEFEEEVNSTSVMRGHKNVVKCMRMCGGKLWTGSNDRSVIVWAPEMGPKGLRFVEKAKLLGHEGGVFCLRKWNGMMVSAGMESSVRCWDMNGRSVRVIKTPFQQVDRMKTITFPSSPTSSKSPTPSRLASNNSSTTSSKTTSSPSTEPVKPNGQRSTSGAVATSQRSRTRSFLVCAGDKDEDIRVWNENGECVGVLKGNEAGVSCLKKWNGCFWSGGKDGRIRGWTMQQLSALVSELGDAVKVEGNGKEEDEKRRHQCAEIACEKELSGHTQAVNCLLGWNGNLYSGGSDRTIRVWNAKGEMLRVFPEIRSAVFNMKLWNGLLVSSGHFDTKGVYLWNEEGNLIQNLKDEQNRGLRVLRVCGGLLCGGSCGIVNVWECKFTEKPVVSAATSTATVTLDLSSSSSSSSAVVGSPTNGSLTASTTSTMRGGNGSGSEGGSGSGSGDDGEAVEGTSPSSSPLKRRGTWHFWNKSK